MVAETNRLVLREITPADALFMYELNLDPEVVKFTGDKPFSEVNQARHFLENYSHYSQYGFGRWLVIRKADSALLGWCGLKYSPETDEYDLGFRFFQQFWGNGYATEAASVCLEMGFNSFNMSTIIGRAMKENVASVAVLKKLGMVFTKEIDFNGKEGVVYEITSEQFLQIQ